MKPPRKNKIPTEPHKKGKKIYITKKTKTKTLVERNSNATCRATDQCQPLPKLAKPQLAISNTSLNNYWTPTLPDSQITPPPLTRLRTIDLELLAFNNNTNIH